MRFRPRFGLVESLYVAVVGMDVAECFLQKHVSSGLAFNTIIFSFLAAARLLEVFGSSWDVEAAGLSARRLSVVQHVPWDEITRVAAANPRWLTLNRVEIEYYRPAPMSERGTIRAHPQHRDQFLAELQKRAPGAAFAV